jgi:DNA-binding transcriptional LysR family regulator
MDSATLKAFVIVADTASFSLAAEKLFITQPAVSKRIGALEAGLGRQLFDRLGKQVQLTEAGRLLLPRARHILAEMDAANRAMADLSGDVRGDLHVATSHHIGLHKLPPVLKTFSEQFPRVNLRFEFLDSEVACQRVLEGRCELALVTLPPITPALLCATPLWRDPLVFVCHPGSELALAPSLVTLSQSPAILPDLNTYTGQLIHRYFESQGLGLNISMATNFLETIKMLCSVGLGWSLLPDSLVDNQLHRLPLPEHPLSRDLGLIEHRDRTPSNAAAAFKNALMRGLVTPNHL